MSKNIIQHVRGPFGVLFLSASLLGGCAGHGDHVKGGMSAAEKRSIQIKSSTEWNMAHQAFLTGNLAKAIRKVDESIRMNPTVAKSHVLRGRILLEQGKLGDAIESFDIAIEFKPQGDDAHYYRGVIFERLVRLDEALAAYQTAASIEPDKAQYAIASAEVMMDLDRFADATQTLETYSSTNPDKAAVIQTLGTIAMLEERFDDAAWLFNEARLLTPEDGAVLENLAAAQMATGRFAEAEFYLMTLLSAENNFDRRDLKQMRAQCLIELDRPVEARVVLLELVDDPQGTTDASAWITLGQVAWRLNDQQSVRRAAKRATQLAPDNADSWVIQALAMREAGIPVKALEATDRALKLDGQNQMILTLRGLVLQELGRHEDALVTLQQAYILDPSNESVRSLIDAVHTARALAIVEDN